MVQGCEMILSIVANFAVISILQNQLIKYKFKCQIKKKWRKFTIHRSITTFQFHLTMHFLHNCNATLMNNCHGQKQTPISVTKVTHEKHCRRNKILCSKSCGHKISINFVDCLLPPGDFQLAGITGYFLATKPTTWYRKWFHHEYTMRKKMKEGKKTTKVSWRRWWFPIVALAWHGFLLSSYCTTAAMTMKWYGAQVVLDFYRLGRTPIFPSTQVDSPECVSPISVDLWIWLWINNKLFDYQRGNK